MASNYSKPLKMSFKNIWRFSACRQESLKKQVNSKNHISGLYEIYILSAHEAEEYIPRRLCHMFFWKGAHFLLR